jgi:hypothetical protein
LFLCLVTKLLGGGGVEGLDGQKSSVEASNVSGRAQVLLDGLLGAKQPLDERLEEVDNGAEQRRLENVLGHVDNEGGNVGQEVLDTGVDEELVDGLVELGSLLDGSEEGVEVDHQTLEEVDSSGADLVDVEVDKSSSSVLDELATKLQQANEEVDVTGEVEEAHGLRLGLGGKGAGSQGEDGSVLLDELTSVLAGDLEVSGLQLLGGSGNGGGCDNSKGDVRELHCCERVLEVSEGSLVSERRGLRMVSQLRAVAHIYNSRNSLPSTQA